MRRRRASRFRGRRRSVSWLPGFTTYDPPAGLYYRTINLTTAGFATANLWGAAISLVANSDLPVHGGEECVLTRVVGRLGFSNGRRNTGAGFAGCNFQMRVAVVQGSQIPGSATILSDEVCTTSGMGKDNILFSKDVMVSAADVSLTGSGIDTMFTSGPFWQLDVDIKAKRKVNEDSPILIWFETVLPAGATAADCRVYGGLRSLLMRPR